MRFSCCLNTLFKGIPLEEAAISAKACGFDMIEFWNLPEDIPSFCELLKKHDIEVASFIANRGASLFEDDCDKVLKTLEGSFKTANLLGCKRMILSLDTAPEGTVIEGAIYEKIISILKPAAKLAKEMGVTIMLEPLNSVVDHPVCPLNNTDIACKLIDEVNLPSLTLLYDIYHRQLSHGNVINDFTEKMKYIDYIHIAGVPGRGEPYLSENDYRFIAGKLFENGYNGIVGFEFFCFVDTPEQAAEKTFSLFKN